MNDYLDPTQLKRIQQRDPEAITQIVREHADTLLKVSWGMGWKTQDAEELVQETLATFLKNVDQFEGRSSVRTYLIGILYMKAQEKRRLDRRQISTEPTDEVFDGHFGAFGIWRSAPQGPEEGALNQETAEIISNCLSSLPDQYRMAFYLREIEQESTESICKILEVSVTNFGVLLFRARNKLRECVERKWGGAR